MKQNTKSKRNFAPLEFVTTLNNHNVVLCKGKPESIEDDVQYYFFKCSVCDGECTSQPQFYNRKNTMCASCASKIGFKGVWHNNGNAKLVEEAYGSCTCSACTYRRKNPN